MNKGIDILQLIQYLNRIMIQHGNELVCEFDRMKITDWDGKTIKVIH